MAGVEITKESRGRTITKTLHGYSGTRTFVGPQATIISDLGKVANSGYIGAHWPQDFAHSGWTLVSNANVRNVELQYEFGQIDARAIVTYSSEPIGGGAATQEKLVNTFYDELTTSLQEEDLGAKDGITARILQAGDADGNVITEPTVRLFLPIAIATRYYWYDHIPSFAGVYTMTGRLNGSTFMGASPSYLMCIGATVRQIETDKWEGQFAFQMSPKYALSGQRHWNQIHKDEDGNYIPIFTSVNFRTSIEGL